MRVEANVNVPGIKLGHQRSIAVQVGVCETRRRNATYVLHSGRTLQSRRKGRMQVGQPRIFRRLAAGNIKAGLRVGPGMLSHPT
jgi:hypothetical protein